MGKKWRSHGLFYVFFLLIILVIPNYSLNYLINSSEYLLDATELKVNQLSANHGVIYLTNNTQLDDYCSGNGTDGSYGNPHIFEDFIINAEKSTSAIYLINITRNLIIQNCTVMNGATSHNHAGIKLVNCANITIQNSSIINNRYGLSIEQCLNNTVIENNITHNNYCGVYCESSNDSLFMDNRIEQNDVLGFESYKSCNNRFLRNKFTDQQYNLRTYYGENCTIRENIFSEGTYGYVLNTCLNMSIINNSVSELFDGFNLAAVDNATVRLNTIENISSSAIYVASLDYCIITNNTFLNAYYGCHGNSVENITISNNKFQEINRMAIHFWNVTNSTLQSNNITHNFRGLNIDHSYNNTITGNRITSTSEGLIDIYLYYSENNTLQRNELTGAGFKFNEAWENDVDTSNHVNGRIFYYIRLNNTVELNRSHNVGQVILFNCSSFRLYDLNVSNTVIGISSWNGSLGVINNCTAKNIKETGLSIYFCYNIQVSDCNVTLAKNYGIYLNNCDGAKIENNSVSSSGNGIYTVWTSNQIIRNNLCFENDEFSIGLYGCNDCVIKNNTVKSSHTGIVMWLGVNETINNNSFSQSYIGLDLVLIQNSTVEYNNASTNHIGMRLVWYASHNKISENLFTCNLLTGLLLHYACENNTIIDNNASCNFYNGIKLEYICENNTIANNTASRNEYNGIQIISSDNNLITNNTADYNYYSGIYMYQADNNTISRNNASYNQYNGLYLQRSNENNITHNNFFHSENGIYLQSSDNVTFYKNNVSHNSADGIYLAFSHNCTIIGNNITDNSRYGITLDGSNMNFVINNTLVNNRQGCIYDNGYDNEIVNNQCRGSIGALMQTIGYSFLGVGLVAAVGFGVYYIYKRKDGSLNPWEAFARKEKS